jgi:hypothetical protein
VKRHLLLLLTLCSAAAVSAQDLQLQLHYDPRHTFNNIGERDFLTSTVEFFKPDRWGSTFFFVDMDYTADRGMGGAYWDIARDLKFWQAPVALHVEYNGGLVEGFAFGNAYLLGAAYSYNHSSFSRGISFSVNYKYIEKTFDDQPHNFQLTAVWYLHLLEQRLSFTGFADFWREKSSFDTRFIFLAEPQLWLNLNKFKSVPNDFNLSAGTEIKLRHNFEQKGLYVIPTLALKWTF